MQNSKCRMQTLTGQIIRAGEGANSGATKTLNQYDARLTQRDLDTTHEFAFRRCGFGFFEITDERARYLPRSFATSAAGIARR